MNKIFQFIRKLTGQQTKVSGPKKVFKIDALVTFRNKKVTDFKSCRIEAESADEAKKILCETFIQGLRFEYSTKEVNAKVINIEREFE